MRPLKLEYGLSIEREGYFEPIAFFSQENRARRLAQLIANETRLRVNVDSFDRPALRGQVVWAEMPKRKVNGKTIPESSVPVVMSEWASILEAVKADLKERGVRFRTMSAEARNVAIRTYKG